MTTRRSLAALAVAIMLGATPLPAVAQGPSHVVLLPMVRDAATGVRGTLADAPQQHATVWLVRLAPVEAPDEVQLISTEGSGYYMLDPSECPRGTLGPDGRFFVRATPGRYYVMVSRGSGAWRIVRDECGYPEMFIVASGEVLDIGERSAS